MKKLYILIAIALFSIEGFTQCSPKLPANTIKITSDTVLKVTCNGNAANSFLICPGAKLTYTDTSSSGCMDKFYLESGAELWIDSASTYSYRDVFVKAGAIADLNHAYWTLAFEAGATIIDSLVAPAQHTVCASFAFDYGSVPGGKCVSAGIDDHLSNESMKAYYMASEEKLVLETQGAFDYTVFDIQGRLVLKGQAFEKMTIESFSLGNSGLYLIRLNSFKSTSVKKVLIH